MSSTSHAIALDLQRGQSAPQTSATPSLLQGAYVLAGGSGHGGVHPGNGTLGTAAARAITRRGTAVGVP